MVLVPIEDGCFCLDTSGGFLGLLWNTAVAPPSDGWEGSFFRVYTVEMSRVQDTQGKAFWLLKNKKWRGKKKSESTSVTKTCSELFLMVTKWNVPFLDYSQSLFKVNKNDLCFPGLLFPCNVSAGITFLVSTTWMLMNVRGQQGVCGFHHLFCNLP